MSEERGEDSGFGWGGRISMECPLGGFLCLPLLFGPHTSVVPALVGIQPGALFCRLSLLWEALLHLSLEGASLWAPPALMDCCHTSSLLSLTSYVFVSPSDQEFLRAGACLIAPCICSSCDGARKEG